MFSHNFKKHHMEKYIKELIISLILVCVLLIFLTPAYLIHQDNEKYSLVRKNLEEIVNTSRKYLIENDDLHVSVSRLIDEEFLFTIRPIGNENYNELIVSRGRNKNRLIIKGDTIGSNRDVIVEYDFQ